MSVEELERRVVALERTVEQLKRERSGVANGTFDWEASVAKFENDQHVLSVLKDAMKLRDKERRVAQKKSSDRRRAKS